MPESFKPIDEFPTTEDEPPAVGTRFTFRDGLHEWAGSKRGKRVGRMDGLCTFLRVSTVRFSVTLYCGVEAKVPGGRISLAGFVTFGEEQGVFVVPVIGGTGRFANARGTVTLRDLPSGSSAIVFRLTP